MGYTSLQHLGVMDTNFSHELYRFMSACQQLVVGELVEDLFFAMNCERNGISMYLLSVI